MRFQGHRGSANSCDLRMLDWGSRNRRGHAAVLVACGVLLAACQPAVRAPIPAPDTARPPKPPTHALLLNGGGNREINYQSHLIHVRKVIELLVRNGVGAEDIAIFSGDGSDPAVDLATRDLNQEAEFWLLPSAAARYLRPPIIYVDSSIEGFNLRPARQAALRSWFTSEGSRLRDGDTLLLYVTDHGDLNEQDLTNNTITLWKETLSVAELRDMLALLDPNVRVLMLMSQCFSGSFAHSMSPSQDELPTGHICGYFASTADRPAYGCYPENRGKDGVGHSHHFLEALDTLGSFPEAQRRVLVSDDTPDVPRTTSELFITERLERAAAQAGRDPSAFIDESIESAWKNADQWEADIRLLDRIGETFGVFSPRSLAELDRQTEVLPTVNERLGAYAKRWQAALDALRTENLRRFIDTHPEWKPRLASKALGELEPKERQSTAQALLQELVPFTKKSAARYARMASLRRRAGDALAARYRMEVRLGVILRLRAVLTSIAGREYLHRRGTAREREALAALLACENLTVAPGSSVTTAAALDPPERFPSFEEDMRLVETITPAWMGIRYRPVSAARRDRDGTPDGAVTVLTVFPNSAAAAAGLRVGDIITGPPGEPFEEPNEVREWTMRREIGEPAELTILRDESLQRVTIRPDPFPLEMPILPGPPKVGSVAPPIRVEPFRGETQFAAASPRLLFFWATWCVACKSALPELEAFRQANDIEVVAITDEDPETLRGFFDTLTGPFPEIVATDPYRRTFQAFGVSGTPTFVLIDGDEKVKHYQTGYSPIAGLGIAGWEWKRRAATSSNERWVLSTGTMR